MNDVPTLIDAIDTLLVKDEEQLRRACDEADKVYSAYEDLMRRLRLEIAAKAGAAGATHLRG